MQTRYQNQPQGSARIDAGTALSQYLSSVWVPGLDTINQSGASAICLDRKGNSHLVTATGGGRTRAYGPQGVFYADTGTGFVTGNLAKSITAFPLVFIVAGYFSNGSSGWTLAAINTSGGGGGSSRCDIILVSATEIDYNIRNNFGTIATVAGTGLSNVTSGAFFTCVAQSLSATDHRLYINGTQYTSATNMGAMTNPYVSMAIGGQATGGAVTANLAGGVLFAATGTIALPDKMALELSASPRMFWQMFPRQSGRYRYMAGAAAAADNLFAQACL